MEKSNHKERLFHPLQSKKKQLKKTVTLLTGNKGIFKVTNKIIFTSVNQSLMMISVFFLSHHELSK